MKTLSLPAVGGRGRGGFPLKVGFPFGSPSLTCEGRAGWASEVSIHVYIEG